LNLSELHEKVLKTKAKVKNLFSNQINKQNSDERRTEQQAKPNIGKSFKMIGKGFTTGLGAGVNVFG